MLDVDIYGEGENVVLLHGCPVPPESMRSVWEWLEGSYRVIVPNLTGIGLDLLESLEPIEEALQAHGVEQAALIGHSLGFYRALQLAGSDGIDVTKIVGLGPIAHVTDEALAQYAGLADAIEAGGFDVAGVALSLWYPAPYLEANPQAAATVRRWFEEMGDQVIIDTLRNEFGGPDLHPILEDIDVPVYLQVGDLDVATPPGLAEVIAEGLSDVRLDVFTGVGHFLHDEASEATLSAVERFLRG
ncbi:MAG: alpha/beta fold hydrolase [Bradymonadaceae bacterium]